MLPLFPVPVVELDGKRPHRAPTSSAKLWLPLSQNGKRTKWNLSSKFNGSRACREFLTRGSELVLPSCSTRITEARMATTGRALFAVRSPFCPITRSSPRFSGVWLNFGGVTSESIGIIDRYLSPENGVSGNWWCSSISLCLHFSLFYFSNERSFSAFYIWDL